MLAVTMTGLACRKGTGEPTLLQARKQFYVADLPVPARFVLDEQKSNYVYTAGRRRVKNLYEGRDSLLAVRNFYVHNMALAGWELTDDTLASNVYTLKYRKAEERCDIRIEQTPRGFRKVTQIWANIRSENEPSTPTP
jgi:hypothetical protein